MWQAIEQYPARCATQAAATVAVAALLLLSCGPTAVGTGRAPAAPVSAGAGQSAAGASSGAPAAAPLRAAYTTIALSAAPWWMALEGGYFREQGLDATLSHVDPGAAILAALSNGEVEMTFSGGPALVLGHLQGLDTIFIGSTSNTLDTAVFTRPDLRTVEDLRGKTIGVSRLKAITDVAARLGFKRVGLQPDVDVFTRGTGGLAESLAAIETGVTDGASLSVPAMFEAQKRGYHKILDMSDLGVPFLNSGVGTTRKTITQRPELGEPVLRALAQANSRYKTDRDYAVTVLAKYTQMDDLELLGASVDHYRRLWLTDLYPDPQALQAVIDAEEHPAARTARPEDMTDYRFAERLRASGFFEQLPR
jgi:NitT/TauT family transport system substrate-binding protein